MKTKNTFLFTFYYAIKKYFCIPVLMALGILAGHATSLNQINQLFISVSKFDPNLEAMNKAKEAIANMKYSFIYVPQDGWSSNADQLLAFLLISIILSAFLGIFIFKFVTSKKTVNVYYSLGIKRAELFTARYLAGAAMIFAAILIPLLIVAFVNVAWFGSNVMLWKAFFFYLFHYNVICLAAYTIAAAVSGYIGTMFEAVSFTAILLAFPAVAYVCFSNLFGALLHGAPPVSDFISVFGQLDNKFIKFSIEDTVAGKILQNVNLFTLNKTTFYKMGQVIDKESAKNFSFPSLMPYLLWIIAIVAIFFLGVYMFKKRKAEICGFTGKNKVLNSVASALISFFVISLIAGKINNVFVLVLVALLISFVIFSIIELILSRSFKDYKKSLKIYPIHAVLILVLIGTLASGFFGYSKRIPEAKEIKSAKITLIAPLMGLDDNRVYDNKQDINFLLSIKDETANFFYIGFDANFILTDINDEESIKAVLDIHKQVIEDGMLHKESEGDRLDYKKRTNGMTLAIKYTLKDGSEFTRYYERNSNKAYEKVLALQDTPYWQKYIENNFRQRDIKNTITALYSKQLEKRTFINKDLRQSFLNAVAADLREMTANEIWMPKSEYLGSAIIYDNPKFSSTGLVDPSVDAATHQLGNDASPEEIIKKLTDSNPLSLYHDSFSTVIPITADMKNTVNFLEKNNLLAVLKDESPVVSARYIEAGSLTAHTKYMNSKISAPIFNSFWDDGKAVAHTEKQGDYTYKNNYSSGALMPKNSKTVSDRNTINALLKNAYGTYADLDGSSAYIVEFTRKDGTKTIMYVPSNRVTLN